MKFILAALCAMALCHVVTAQELSSGFMVTVREDTVKGFLREGTDAELGSGVIFSGRSSGGDDISYSASELLGFGFDYGRIFQRFSIDGRPGEVDSVLVFAKKVLEGKISLYTYSKPDAKQPDIFLVNNHTEQTYYVQKPEKVSVTDSNGIERTGESTKFAGLIRLAKGESPSVPKSNKRAIYSEKAIRKDIQKYNDRFNDFPTSQYKPQITYHYVVTAGVPISAPNEDVAFRVAFFRNKYFPESSRTFSFISGVSYRYTSANSPPPTGVQNSHAYFRHQWLSLIPAGMSFQAKSGLIRPYCYAGGGIVLLWTTDHHVENYEYKGLKTDLLTGLTLSIGAGVRIKAGTRFIVVEVSPTAYGGGTFVNLGYVF